MGNSRAANGKVRGKVLSNAFALSHDSYSTIRTNYRRDRDYQARKQNLHVDRLLKRINGSQSPTGFKYYSTR